MARKRAVGIEGWENPPTSKPAQAAMDHSVAAATLKSNPGVWGKVRSYKAHSTAATVAYQIRTGYLASYRPKGSYQAVSRTLEGTHWVFARYVGEDGEHAQD